MPLRNRQLFTVPLLGNLSISKNRVFLFLTFFFLIRIIYSYFFGYQEFIRINSDGVSYNGYALAILNQSDWLTNPDFLGDYRPPVYPLFVAAIYSIFGIENYFAVYFFQVIINTLTIYYIFKLSASVFDERASLLALFWSGFNMYYIYYTGVLLRESLIFFLIIYSFYHLLIFLKIKEKLHFFKNVDLWKFLIAFTILIHTDARYLFYIPFYSILFVTYKYFWTGIKQYSFVLIMLMLFLIPWTMRNYIAYDGFVLINTRTLDMRQKDVIFRANYLRTEKITHTTNEDYPSEEERELIKKGKNPNNRMSLEIEAIINDVYPPSTFMERKFFYFSRMWVPFRFWSGYSPLPSAKFELPWSLKHNLMSIIFYGTLIPFLVYSIYYLIKRQNKAVWFLIFPIVIQAALHFLMWGRERYRLHIEAFIIILGCHGIIIAYSFIKQKLIRSKSIN